MDMTKDAQLSLKKKKRKYKKERLKHGMSKKKKCNSQHLSTHI
jgi:hypothetical protein